MTRREWARGGASLDVAVVLVAIVVALVVALLIRSGPAADAPGTPPRAEATGGPSPRVGQRIRAEIRPDGVLEFVHRLSAPEPVSYLLVRAAPSGGWSGPTTLQDLELASAGVPMAALTSVGRTTQQMALGRSVWQLTATYRLPDAVDERAGTEPGRALAYVPPLGIDYRGETGPVRLRVVAPGEVLNAACVRPGGAGPRPCGSPTDGGWRVDLTGADRDDALLVQLQLD